VANRAIYLATWKKLRSTRICDWTGINVEIELVQTYDEIFEYFCQSRITKLGFQPYFPNVDPEMKAGDAE
jgi:hypothetical protein